MISAKALCFAFRQPLAEHWGYIWGEAGDVWTRAAQDAATREMLGVLFINNDRA